NGGVVVGVRCVFMSLGRRGGLLASFCDRAPAGGITFRCMARMGQFINALLDLRLESASFVALCFGSGGAVVLALLLALLRALVGVLAICGCCGAGWLTRTCSTILTAGRRRGGGLRGRGHL